MEGAGTVSSNVEEVELRGITYNEPYYEVSAYREAPTKGWAYGGALVCLYTGPKADAPNREQVSALATYLNQLDPKELSSGGKAWTYIQTQLSEAQGPLADAAFFLLERFLQRMETEGEYYKVTEKVPFSEADIKAVLDGNFNTEKFPTTAALAAGGFRLTTGEGTIFPIVDWRKFQDYFGPISTSAMQKYINQRTAEQNVPMFDDGGILIPIYLVADVAAFWEKFNRENPHFPRAAECQESERAMTNTVLMGSNNTPIYNSETKEIEKDFILAWRYVLREFPDTKLGRKVKGLYDLCEAEAWKYTPKVEMYISSLQQ